jgi:hypothetical protein
VARASAWAALLGGNARASAQGMRLPTRKSPVSISLRHRETFALEVIKQGMFVLWRPPVVISIPTGIASEDVAVQCQPVPFVSMRALLIGRSANVALRDDFVLSHGVSYYIAAQRCGLRRASRITRKSAMPAARPQHQKLDIGWLTKHPYLLIHVDRECPNLRTRQPARGLVTLPMCSLSQKQMQVSNRPRPKA